MDQTRQRMASVTVGILYRTGAPHSCEREALAEWIVKDRVSMVTGYFGNTPQFVEDLAKQAGAIHSMPLFQGLKVSTGIHESEDWCTHPSWFLLFGCWRAVRWPDAVDIYPRDMGMGDDINQEMIHSTDIPEWPLNSEGSAFVPNHGNIKLKAADFDRWCSYSLQTCLWMGTSTPGRNSQYKFIDRSRGKGWKGSGKGKGKGKGKGAGK